MTAPALLQLVPAFILGCILTEIRWIVRMRQLRGQMGRRESANEYPGERLTPSDSDAAGPLAFDLSESLRNLSRQMAAEAPVSRLRERPVTTKS